MCKVTTVFGLVVIAMFICQTISVSGLRIARSPGKMEVDTPDNSEKLGSKGGELESDAEEEDDYWDQDRQKKEKLNRKDNDAEPESPEGGPIEPNQQSDNGEDDESNGLPNQDISGSEVESNQPAVDEPETTTDLNVDQNQGTEVTQPNQEIGEPSQQSASDDENDGRFDDVDEDVNNKTERYENKGGEKSQQRQDEYENNNYQRPTVSYE